MPIEQRIWNITTKPKQLKALNVLSEKDLEDAIADCPEILSEDWMLIGRQITLDGAGRLDLLAIDPAQNLIVIELKKDRTPRDVVTQCLDYGSVISQWNVAQIISVYESYKPERKLKTDFEKFFRRPFEEDAFEGHHQLVVVASALDQSSERIVRYLSDSGTPINVLFFNIWADSEEIFLSRAWFLDPVEAQLNASGEQDVEISSWNGEYYVSFGEGEHRLWKEAVRYGFISGGGKPFHSRTLSLLKPGCRVWVNIPKTGYVGVGTVTASAMPISEVKVTQEDREIDLIDRLESRDYHKSLRTNIDKQDYAVRINWHETTDTSKAYRRTGLFGNQNTVCKPKTLKWEKTIQYLKTCFSKYGSEI